MKILNRFKDSWNQHRVITAYISFAFATLIFIVTGCIVNMFIDSKALSITVTLVTICLNFVSVYYIWILYSKFWRVSYKRAVEHHPVAMKQHEEFREHYRKYPGLGEMPQWLIDPPIDFPKSYRKMRWIYWAGIGMNFLLGVFNIWHLVHFKL